MTSENFSDSKILKPEQQEKTPLELKQETQSLIDELNLAIGKGDYEKAEALQDKIDERMKMLEEKLRERAREILGKNFYGPEEIEKAFGFTIDKSEIPTIPYSHKVLEQAKKLGERLILRISHDEEGIPLTMERINEIAQARMIEDEGKFLYDIDGYKGEDFYKNNPLKTEWKLVGGSFVENFINKDYIEQTKLLRDNLKVIGALTVEEEAECSDEKLAEINEIMEDYWKEAAKLLVNLKINQNHRRTSAEILYDWLLEFKKNKDIGFLEYFYDWSNSLSADGRLVGVGEFDAAGAGVDRWFPSDRDKHLGVVIVR